MSAEKLLLRPFGVDSRSLRASARELRVYLQALVGREPPTSLLELRPLFPGGGAAPGRAWIPVGQLAELERRVYTLAPDAHVFVGVAPRGHGRRCGACVDAVGRLRHHAEPRAAPRVPPAAGDRRAVRLRWRARILAAERAADAGGDAARQPQARERARRRREGDRRRADPAPAGHAQPQARPGTAGPAHPARGVRFAAGEVVGRLPDSEHYRRRPRVSTGGQRLRAGSPRRDRVLAGLTQTVAQAQQGNRNASLYWAACRAVEHVAAGELDERHALDALSMAALEAGLGGVEVRATLESAQQTARRAA